MGELEGGDRAGMEALPAGLDKQQGKGQGGKEEARPGAGGDAGADLDAACHQALGAAGSTTVQGRPEAQRCGQMRGEPVAGAVPAQRRREAASGTVGYPRPFALIRW